MKLNRRSLLGLFGIAPVAAIGKAAPAPAVPEIQDFSHVIMYGEMLKSVPLKEHWLDVGDRIRVSSGEVWFVAEKTYVFANGKATFDLVNEAATPFPSNFYKFT